MSFNIMCPHCQTVLEVQEQWAGMECECPQCKRNFVVPAPAGRPVLKTVTPLRLGDAAQGCPPQNYESQSFDVYNPWGIHICLALAALLAFVLMMFVRGSFFFFFFFPLPLLGFWFLKRNYEELGEEKKQRNAAIFFFLGIIMLAVFAANGIISGVLHLEIPAVLSIIISLFQVLAIPYWIAAIVDSGRFPGLLKKEYGGCTVKSRSIWTMWLLAPLLLLILLLVPAWVRWNMSQQVTECKVHMKEIGMALENHRSDEYLPENLDSLAEGLKCPSGKKYVYLGKGLKWDGDNKYPPILMDAPNAHKGIRCVNILYLDGHVLGFIIRPGTATCVEVLNSLHPGLGISETGRIVLKNAAQADNELDSGRR